MSIVVAAQELDTFGMGVTIEPSGNGDHSSVELVTGFGVTVIVYPSPRDGHVVVELETGEETPHRADGTPQLRVWVNEGMVWSEDADSEGNG